MKITRVDAVALSVPLSFDHFGASQRTRMSCCLVKVETSDGVTGHGLTGIVQERAVAATINQIVGPALVGKDPMCHEAIWEQLYWLLSPRGQTGFGMNAIAALDVALWDIKGKVLGMPLWRLFGGARKRVPVYLTFGFPFLDIETLGKVAEGFHESGFHHLKMVVAADALRRRDEPHDLGRVVVEDSRRIQAVRESIGDEAHLYIDANCNLDYPHAEKLALSARESGITYFEEPITQNDVSLMRQLRARTGVAVAAGQCEGLAYRFRDMLTGEAVDYLQPNVLMSGGYTQALKIAGLASAFNVPITNGGGYPIHNMHLHAGVSNGGMVEWHLLLADMMERLFRGFPRPEAGWLTLPEQPGLGFEPNPEAVEAFQVRDERSE